MKEIGGCLSFILGFACMGIFGVSLTALPFGFFKLQDATVPIPYNTFGVCLIVAPVSLLLALVLFAIGGATQESPITRRRRR